MLQRRTNSKSSRSVHRRRLPAWRYLAGSPLENSNDQPTLTLGHILSPVIAELLPGSLMTEDVNFFDALNCQTLFDRDIKERRELCATGMKAGYSIHATASVWRKKVEHRLCELVVLPRHPKAVCGEDAVEGRFVLSRKGI